MGNFQHLNDHLARLDYHFDVICLSETWNSLTRKSNFKPGVIDGYEPFLGTPGTTLKSGCGFYIKSTLIAKVHERKDLQCSYYDIENEFQSKWIEIVQEKTANIIIGVFYRHPKSGKHNFTEFNKKFISKVRKENKMVCLAGDFNYNLLKYSNDKNVTEFYETMHA